MEFKYAHDLALSGRFDLVDCLHDYRTAITIHGDDVLAHANWEISEQWLSRYKFAPLGSLPRVNAF